ncbi:MAG TPA: glycosyltransferase family 2 protein [Albidovulum sp.]|uniref:glycosyltransferase family 2 protein n=1 Tax=Albidovulum sp. TaxID=1872424 RepID=UPI002C869102|nr:glycosyltransferase family 2 protein [Albidovulum sp.]
MSRPTPTRVLRRPLLAGAAGELPVLDAVVWEENGGRAFRILTRAGVSAGMIGGMPDGTELRDVSGALLIAGMVADDGPIPVPLVSGGVAEVTPAPAERDLLAGRNCLLGVRLEESADVVADWLRYHARHHGATGAVIINRAPEDSPASSAEDFAEVLEEALYDCPGLLVVVLESAVPLGKPGLGPESHAYLAPDAPGKDRMAVPAPDPWRAPLGEPLIYEAAKWRFLAKARAVLCLDVTDVLAADAGVNAFDLCAGARHGVALLVGHRIYPWRVRKGRAATFGDHICRPFDRRRGIARWGVAPEVAGLDNTWRAIRVAFAKPEAGQVVPFWRAMAIRVPGYRAGELAPKSSLIEDPELVALAALFGHLPVHPPVSAPRAVAAGVAAGTRTCIITTMKNEGPFILEWIAYHRAIGVEDFLVYTNDCTDGTDRLLEALQRKGIVQHRDNPFRSMPGLKPQHAALQAAEEEKVVQGSAWAICMDVDEFIDIKIGDGTLPALYAAMGDANMIALTWRLFGNADVAGFEDRFVTEQFTLCAQELVRKPHQAWGFKTLFRNIEIYRKLGVHRPKGLKPDLWDQVRWLNGSGQPLPREMFRNGWRSSVETYGYDWVQLNHYAVRSVESFLVKRDRGRVNHVDRDQGLNYWFRMNHNAVEDRSILRMVPAARAEFDRLMADPDIAALHEGAVAAHRAKIAELMAVKANRAFHADLTGERMQALSRILQSFGSAVFMAGPGVIPPDLHRRELPPGFFFTVEHEGDAEH